MHPKRRVSDVEHVPKSQHETSLAAAGSWATSLVGLAVFGESGSHLEELAHVKGREEFHRHVGDFVALVAKAMGCAGGDLDHVAWADAKDVATTDGDLELALDPRHPLDLVGVDVFWGGTAGGQEPVQANCILLGPLQSKPFARYRILDVCGGHAAVAKA